MSFGVFCLYMESLNNIPIVRTLIVGVLYFETVCGVFREMYGVSVSQISTGTVQKKI